MSYPFNHARAKALGGEKIDGDVYELRSHYEGKLIAPLNKLRSCCQVSETLRLKLPVQSDYLPAETVDVTGLLLQARQAHLHQSKDLEFAVRSKESMRMDRGLTRNPRKPDTVSGLLYSGLMILVEGGINTSFFVNAHMVASPSSALLLSVLISATNVLTSTCAGYFIGRKRHLGANQNDPALLEHQKKANQQFYIYLAGMALFHSTVGLVRSQETLEKVTHSIETYQELLVTPEAIFLVFMGISMSGIAYYHGLHSFNDCYPGFGRRGEAVQEQINAIAETYDDLAEEIEARFDEAIANTGEEDNNAFASISAFNNAVEDCQIAYLQLQSAVNESESAFKAEIAQLISAYESAKGRRNSQLSDQLQSLASFQSYLDETLPSYYPLPDHSNQVSNLKAQKSEALERLATVFQSSLDDGESQ